MAFTIKKILVSIFCNRFVLLNHPSICFLTIVTVKIKTSSIILQSLTVIYISVYCKKSNNSYIKEQAKYTSDNKYFQNMFNKVLQTWKLRNMTINMTFSIYLK